MNGSEILRLYDEQERKNGRFPSYRWEAAEGVVRNVKLDPAGRSFIIYSDLDESNADRIIAEQIRWFRDEVKGSKLEWKTYDHDRPADLKQRLAAQGFAAEEREALLALDLENCPAVYLEPVTADVRGIIDPAQFKTVADIQAAVYGEPFDQLEKELRKNVKAEPDFWSVYLAFVDGVPASAAWITFPENSQFAGLWGGATRPEYRRRGLYTTLVAARAQEAIRRGYRFLSVDASDMSRPVLVKRGFQLLTYTTPYVWTRNDGG